MKSRIVVILLLAASMCANSASNDLRTRAQVENEVARLLQIQAFNKLDELAKEFRESNSLTLSGYSVLNMFHQALHSQIEIRLNDPKTGGDPDKLAQAWVKASPNSPAGHMVVAEVIISRAWQIRGNDYASVVSKQQWKDFRQLIQQAKEYLLQTRKVSEVDPCWHEWMLRVMTWQSTPEVEYRELLDEALAKFPEYFTLYTAAIDHYSPKWGGSAKSIETFVQKAISRLPVQTQDSMYARSYSYVFQNHFEQVPESLVNCSRWLRGSDDIATMFATPYNFNLAAIAATKCRDRPKAKKYIDLIGDKPLTALWGNPDSAEVEFARARDWALQSR